MALDSVTTAARRLSWRPTARLSPKARIRPMKPSVAPCMTANGSRVWPGPRPAASARRSPAEHGGAEHHAEHDEGQRRAVEAEEEHQRPVLGPGRPRQPDRARARPLEVGAARAA